MTRTLGELQAAAARLMRSVVPRPQFRVAEMAGVVAEAFEAGREFERAAQVAGVAEASRECRYCGRPLRPSGPRPDWAAAVPGYPFPALFCPGRGEDFPVHEPAAVTA